MDPLNRTAAARLCAFLAPRAALTATRMVETGFAGLLLLLPAAARSAEPAAPGGKPVWDRPSLIPAESDLFQDRIADPQNHALLDAQHALVAGKEFHAALGEASWFLWPAHPHLRFMPSRRWLQDSLTWTFRGLVGNEAGDPFLGELAGGEEGGNRTPATLGTVTWSPTGDWSVNAGLDQNDHSSYRTFPARLAVVGEERRDELSWVGGNLPPRSQAQLGGAMHRHGGLLAAQFNRGWWWTVSPVSGRPYAWEGFNADFLYRVGDDFDLSLADQSWQTPGEESPRSARWRRTEVTLAFSGASPGGWRYRLELGGLRRSLWSDSAFRTFEENRYLSRFRYRQVWAPRDGSALRLESQGLLGYGEKLGYAQHMSDLRLTLGRHSFGPGVKAYYRHPLGSYRDPLELLAGGDSGVTAVTAVLEPARHARGVSGSAEYRFHHPLFQASLLGHYANEWGVPVFSGEVIDTLAQVMRIRSGVLGGSDHRYGIYGGRLLLGGPLGRPAAWRLSAGLRGFEGGDADRVELRPSPWWLSGGLSGALPSGLRLEGNLAWLGPKEVRGWGEDFRVRARLEGNAALVQSLLDERLELTAAFLHAFGEDVLEHPNGNPVRFRVLAGARGAF